MPLEAAAPTDAPITVSSERVSGRIWASAVLMLGLWALVINQLRLDWETNPQYSYGWLVPLLAAYLFYSRWPTRPPVEPLRRSHQILLGIAVVLLGLVMLPTRLIREATPDWSTLSWALAIETVLLTLAYLACVGGWKTMLHFAWPVCFFLVAVAWPMRFETAVTQGLMQHLARLTAEILNWCGVSATPSGNLIRLETGTVGVDEACSGVRSLQAMLMGSLFLGELYRFGFFGRVALLCTGLGLAVFFNLTRALLLTTAAVRDGIGAVEKWHDSAGFSILILSFITLCLIVKFCKKPTLDEATTASAQGPRSWGLLPKTALIAGIAWLALTEISTEMWYRSHENLVQEGNWRVRWPEQARGFQEVPISANVTRQLSCNEGRQVSFETEDGDFWQMFSFRWYAGKTSTLAARMHRPEVCLPAAGRKLVAKLPPISIDVRGLEVPFSVYQFEMQGRPLFVFFCLWEIGNRDQAPADEIELVTAGNRIKRALQGQRNLGQQSMEVVINGARNPEEAVAAFRKQAQRMIERES